MRLISRVRIGLFLIWLAQYRFIFVVPMCAYNFIGVLIFLLPKPWLLHTNIPMLYDKLRVTAVGVLCIVRGVGGGGPSHKTTYAFRPRQRFLGWQSSQMLSFELLDYLAEDSIHQ
jgi:hypothetical protein